MGEKFDIIHKVGDRKFNFRTAGIVLHNDRVLLHQGRGDGFWVLPGGRASIMETTGESLKREFEEEIGVDAEVGELKWVVESFFKLGDEHYHEVGMYYKVDFPEDSAIYSEEEVDGIEEGKNLVFKWFRIDQLQNISVQPKFIKEELQNPLGEMKHVVIKE